MADEKENKTIVNKFNVSWYIPWAVGWFFTLGYVGVEGFSDLSFWMQIVVTVGSYIFWPFILGIKLAGG